MWFDIVDPSGIAYRKSFFYRRDCRKRDPEWVEGGGIQLLTYGDEAELAPDLRGTPLCHDVVIFPCCFCFLSEKSVRTSIVNVFGKRTGKLTGGGVD